MAAPTREIAEHSPLVVLGESPNSYLACTFLYHYPNELVSFDVSIEEPKIGIVHAMSRLSESELRDNLYLISLTVVGNGGTITANMDYTHEEPTLVRAVDGVELEDFDRDTSGEDLAIAHLKKLDAEPERFATSLSISALHAFYERLVTSVPRYR